MIQIRGNNVLLAPLPAKTRSNGGVHLAMKYQDDEMQWMVLAVGWGRISRKKGKAPRHVPIEVKRGDHVITPLVHGFKYKFPDGRIIIEADEIIAKVEIER